MKKEKSLKQEQSKEELEAFLAEEAKKLRRAVVAGFIMLIFMLVLAVIAVYNL